MRRRVGPLTIAVLLSGCVLLLALVVGSAQAARVTVGKLILHADGEFTPHQLPRRTYAPINFQGYANIDTKDGSAPPAVQRIQIDYDRDGKLTTAGLPVCQPAQIEGTTTKQARTRCGAAQVGSGHVGAAVSLPFLGRINVRAPLTIFNGPRQAGNQTVIAHAQTAVLLPETYVVVIPVEPRRGAFGYRSTFDLPPIVGGLGALTHIDVKVGRRYRVGGTERSFISARCSDGILQTRGYISFADGTVIYGSLMKFCEAQP